MSTRQLLTNDPDGTSTAGGDTYVVEGDAVLAALVDEDLAGLVTDELMCSTFANLQAQRQAVFANECRMLAALEVRGVYRREGHASMYGWLRAHYGYTNAECRTRMTIARASLRLPEITDALAAGDVPVGHAEVLSRAVTDCWADARVDRGTLESDVGFWLNEGGRDYGDFRTRIEEWSTRLRADRTLQDEQAKRDSRYCKVRRRRDNMVTVDALLDPEAGTHLLEVFGQLAGQAFDADWAEAEAIYGDATTTRHLARNDAQRQADALVDLARLAQANTDSGFSNTPLVSILVDEHTLTDAMIRLGIYPDSAQLPDEHITPSQRVCRTNTGVPLHPTAAAQAAIVGKVRFTLVDRLLNPLRTTSRQRLFTGAMREAVMAISPTCYYPGCNRGVNDCQADHHTEHQDLGPTSITNGAPACPRHNRYKSQHRYQPVQTSRGHWTLPHRQQQRDRQLQLGVTEVRRQ